jgi:acyl carrier protein
LTLITKEDAMSEKEVFDKVVIIIKKFAKDADALAAVSMQTSILKDLKVNSARLVDVVLEMEDEFGIQVNDDQADKVRTVGDAVNLILGKAA